MPFPPKRSASHSQTLAMYAVMRFYHMVRSGISFKVNEIAIELWQNSYDSDENKTSTTISLCPDDVEDDFGYSNCSHSHYAEDIFGSNDDISDKNNEEMKRAAAGEGTDENDSLLVAYDVDSVVSLWHKNIISCRPLRIVKLML